MTETNRLVNKSQNLRGCIGIILLLMSTAFIEVNLILNYKLGFFVMVFLFGFSLGMIASGFSNGRR
jgi:hypothetical protein